MGKRERVVAMALVAGMLLSGSINTVSKKMGYATCSTGLDDVDATSDAMDGCSGDKRKFHKPWSQTLVMFLGESMCMLVFLWRKRRQRASPGELAEAHPSRQAPSDPNTPPPSPITWRTSLLCVLPAMCDVGGTTLSGIGLLFTTASVFQMLRGSIIIFTACFSIVFLKRRVFAYQWCGIGVTVCGIVLVGTSSYLSSSSSSSQSASLVMVGNILVVLSQTMSAFQMVVEEKYLKRHQLPPEFVVGCEGIFGALMMACVVLPLVAYIPFSSCDKDWCKDGGGVHENALDAAELLGNNGFLLFLVLLYWVSIAFYNFCGLAVAKSLSSVHRTLVDACRTMFVWTVDVILFYTTHKKYGEEWDTTPCLVQLGGFVLMVVGTLVYNKVLRLDRCFDYGDDGWVAHNVRDDEDGEAQREGVVGRSAVPPERQPLLHSGGAKQSYS